MPSATQSATALATAYCAGPNIWIGLPGPLDGDLGDQDGGRLDGQVGGQHGEQVGVAGGLVGQRVGERDAHRAGLGADQEVDVGDLIAFAHQGFPDEQRAFAGHLASFSVGGLNVDPGGDRIRRGRPTWGRIISAPHRPRNPPPGGGGPPGPAGREAALTGARHAIRLIKSER